MLTDRAIVRAELKAKPHKLFDADGLYLIVRPNGAKWWRFDYRFGGKRRTLSCGVYPAVRLPAARVKAREARAHLAAGRDPSRARKAEKQATQGKTFKELAVEWLGRREHLARQTRIRDAQVLSTYFYPSIGTVPIGALTAADVLECLRPIETRGKIDTAHRAKQTASQVFLYAVSTGRALRDVTVDLKHALKPIQTTHYPAVTTPAGVAALLRALDRRTGGSEIVRAALRLAPYVFVRPGELRGARWKEFDLEDALWRIPAERMKTGLPHLVPLASQVVTQLRALHNLTGHSPYLFPAVWSSERQMSENTLNKALRRLGYSKDLMVAHGFRSIASTLLNELGEPPDLIERQLAHVEKNQVRAAYNRAVHVKARRRLMQRYADYLDRLRASVDSA